jgi:SPX domain protein involved in polyphosphate accumulation
VRKSDEIRRKDLTTKELDADEAIGHIDDRVNEMSSTLDKLKEVSLGGFIKQKKSHDDLEDRVEVLESELSRLRAEKTNTQSFMEMEYETIYEEHKEELLKNNKGRVVAIDLESRSIAGIGNDIAEAYENARKTLPEKDQFYFRRVGKPYIQKL